MEGLGRVSERKTTLKKNELKSICAFVGCIGVVHPLLNGHSSSNLVVCFFVLCSDAFKVEFLLFAVHFDKGY